MSRCRSVAPTPPQIRIKHVWLTSDLWNGEKIVFRLVIVNVGKTLARLNSGHIVTVIEDADHQLPIESELPKGVHYVISPNTLDSGLTLVLEDHSANRILSDDENGAFRNAAKKLYCIGS